MKYVNVDIVLIIDLFLVAGKKWKKNLKFEFIKQLLLKFL